MTRFLPVCLVAGIVLYAMAISSQPALTQRTSLADAVSPEISGVSIDRLQTFGATGKEQVVVRIDEETEISDVPLVGS